MASETPRFRFTTLDSVNDSLAFRDYKFTNADRVLLDRLLTMAAERHTHSGDPGGGAEETPPTAPLLTTRSTGGVIAANTTVYYRTALVDGRGQAHIASQTAAVTTVPPVAAPGPFFLTPDPGDGVLMPGDYVYAISAYTEISTCETPVSRTSTNLLKAIGGFSLFLPAPPSGATGFNIYRKGPTDRVLTYLTSVVSTEVAWSDRGAIAADKLRGVPTTNTTATTNSVSITPATALPAGATLKIYRTYSPTDWDSSLLVWTAVAPVVDTGHATQEGSPPDAGAAVEAPDKIDILADTLGVIPPGMHTVTRLFNYTAYGRIIEGPGTWAWVSEYAQAGLVSIRAARTRDAAPAGANIVVCLERADGTPIGFGSAPQECTIFAGDTMSAVVPFEGVDNPIVTVGEPIILRVLQDGSGGAGTVNDLEVTVTIRAHAGSTTESYEWETG